MNSDDQIWDCCLPGWTRSWPWIMGEDFTVWNDFSHWVGLCLSMRRIWDLVFHMFRTCIWMVKVCSAFHYKNDIDICFFMIHHCKMYDGHIVTLSWMFYLFLSGIDLRLYTYMYVCMHAYIHIHMYIGMYIHMCVCTYVYTYIPTHTPHTHRHLHKHRHTHSLILSGLRWCLEHHLLVTNLSFVSITLSLVPKQLVHIVLSTQFN